jgi:hypothetical protein
MGLTLALTHLSFGASRRRRRSQAGRATMLPRQSKILDTDDTDDIDDTENRWAQPVFIRDLCPGDTDDTDPTDRNGQKSVSAARVYPCPMPWSDGGAASPGSSGAKTGFPATALRGAAAAARPSLLRMTWGRQHRTDTLHRRREEDRTEASGNRGFLPWSLVGPVCSRKDPTWPICQNLHPLLLSSLPPTPQR